MRIDELYEKTFGKPFDDFVGFTEIEASILKSEILKLSEPNQCDVLYSIVDCISDPVWTGLDDKLATHEINRNQIFRNFIHLPEWKIFRKEHFLYEPPETT